MYELLGSSKLAISIPTSDSSPRSVYEAIFLGCCVAVTYNSWINELPDCMKSRLIIINLKNKLWLKDAIKFADEMKKITYKPSELALEMFDQKKSMKIILDKYF